MGSGTCARAPPLPAPAPAPPSYQTSVSGKMCGNGWQASSNGKTYTCRAKCCRFTYGGDAYCLPVGASILEPCAKYSSGFTTFATESDTPINLMVLGVCAGFSVGALLVLVVMNLRHTW